MGRHWEYLLYVLRHKWFVFWAGIGLGVNPIWLILHDWDKFLPSMWFAYARTFYKPDGTSQYVPLDDFDSAWNAHQKRNKHHWQYWLLTPDRAWLRFTDQSHDGGISHAFIATTDTSNLAAWIYDHEVNLPMPDPIFTSELIRCANNAPMPLDMPLRHRLEMLADWIGAGRALGKPFVWVLTFRVVRS